MPDDNDTNDEPTQRDVPLDQDELLARYGNQERVIQKLITKIDNLEADNADLRQERRELREQAPSDDQVVLGEEEADELRELGALGEDGTVQADQVQERLEEAESAQEELQAYRRREQRRQVYEAEGLNEEAAEDILPDDLDFEVEEGEDEETAAYVRTEDGRTPVSEYIEESFSEPIQQALTGEVSGSEESSTQDVPDQTPAGEDTPGEQAPDADEIRQQKRQQINYGV
jgi:hypothetical protein